MGTAKRVNWCYLVLVLTLALFSAGCSSKKTGGMTPGEGEDGALSENDLNAMRENRYGAGGIPTAEGEGMFRDIHFDYDSSAISDQARQEVDYNRQILEANPDLKVQLEGHSDERGTAQYNLALGQRRARAVFDMLVGLGIPPSRMDTISYGEEVPLDAASNEAAWAKNRRVHLSPFTK